MSEKKQIHYNIDDIANLGCNYNLIFGEKSNGKSYQVKHKFGIEPALKNPEQKFYLTRRFKEELTPSKVEKWLADVNITSLTDGEYNTFVAYRNRIYLGFYNIDTCKTLKGPVIGYYDSLSREQNNAGGSFLDVSNIIFEEFMSRSVYLPNEPAKLQTLYSTIDRKRATTRVWMVGNTVTRICPYFQSWGLDKLIRNMQQGDITTHVIEPENLEEDDDLSKFTLAIEYCKSSGGNKTAFGYGSGAIDAGKWMSDPQPRLPKSIKEYRLIYRVGFFYAGYKWLGDVLVDSDHSLCWFIYPKPIEEDFTDILLFSDQPSPNKWIWGNPYNCGLNNAKLQNILSTFTESKIFYSDDLTGTDFKKAINFIIRK